MHSIFFYHFPNSTETPLPANLSPSYLADEYLNKFIINKLDKLQA